jgi:hypothetical protein
MKINNRQKNEELGVLGGKKMGVDKRSRTMYRIIVEGRG